MPKQPKAAPGKTTRDYEQLGQMLDNIYQSGYIDRNQAYKMSFFKGIAGGLGSVLGATIGIALLLWILSLFNQIPLVGQFTEKVQDTVKTQKEKPTP